MRYGVFIISLAVLCLACTLPSMAQEPQADRGPLISIEMRDVQIRDVLRALSQEHGINIIVDDTVTGTVTVSIKGVPLWDAIEAILRSKSFTYRTIRPGLLLIEPLSEYAKKQEDVVIKEFRLKYLKASDSAVTGAIGSLKSEKGQVIPLNATNSLVVRDLPEVVARIEKLLESMDIKPEQIMIEARIVEMRTSLSRELGIQWGGTYTGTRGTDSLAVNLPIASGSAAGTLGLGFIKNRVALDAQLTALETSGEAKIVSSPRIRVLENQSAVITSGEERNILITNATTTGTTTASTAGVSTVSANLELSVTPRTVSGNQVSMEINTTRDEFNESLSSQAQPIPPKLTKKAKTQLIVKDGETIVIGGIYSKNEFKGERRVPFLGRIPILGWLFKTQRKTNEQNELLIFITPTIIKEEKALSASPPP